MTLTGLGVLYKAQGRYTEAEFLYKRALCIEEKAFGPEHPDIATLLENYANLLHLTNRKTEADKLAARAAAIRAR